MRNKCQQVFWTTAWQKHLCLKSKSKSCPFPWHPINDGDPVPSSIHTTPTLFALSSYFAVKLAAVNFLLPQWTSLGGATRPKLLLAPRFTVIGGAASEATLWLTEWEYSSCSDSQRKDKKGGFSKGQTAGLKQRAASCLPWISYITDSSSGRRKLEALNRETITLIRGRQPGLDFK